MWKIHLTSQVSYELQIACSISDTLYILLFNKIYALSIFIGILNNLYFLFVLF